jgi:plastocyanin
MIRFARRLAPLALAVPVAAALLPGLTWRGSTQAQTSAQAQPSGQAPPSGAAKAAVTVQGFQFRPTPLEVKSGTHVTWTNGDDITHTVTSGTPESREGRFASPLPGKGTTFGFTFTEPGTYPYHCERHQTMRGEIRVN